ncbi:hypothetical protein [Oleiagrimonas soli]|uniref:Type 1 fimbrial protein n=1 Tax=Oleiagrimonas soli TaxID=1543381 RepID=A0A099CZ42_9GAMM|nr:hypothetical protein [Oleiagrimonas soli]KGI78931.1 hypothetical protein LF63_0101590 [Oleiagrimonas soli]MBB6184569.1 hypothetical protein [Oleiagrimonas soli]
MWGACCALALLGVQVPAAQAADGRITFHGAVRTPTCAPAVPAAASPRAVETAVLACPETATAGKASSARLYSVQVEAMPGDMLQGEAYAYFAGYVQQRSDLKLVVQRFE